MYLNQLNACQRQVRIEHNESGTWFMPSIYPELVVRRSRPIHVTGNGKTIQFICDHVLRTFVICIQDYKSNKNCKTYFHQCVRHGSIEIVSLS